jgi:hypothetical protein
MYQIRNSKDIKANSSSNKSKTRIVSQPNSNYTMDQSVNNMLSNSHFANDERHDGDINVTWENQADGINNSRHIVDEILIRERY